MRQHETSLEGAYRIELDPKVDARGAFTRTFCRGEFERLGLESHLEQCNMVINRGAGTLRGIHYHVPPRGEVKIIQCVRGAVFDVLVDLRPESKTYGQWTAAELSAASAELLYIPRGLGHAYQTLEPDTVLTYFMSEAFVPGTEQGIRWNDALFAIPWPIVPPILSERDRTLADFDLEEHRRQCRLAVAGARGCSPANVRSRR